MTSQLNVLIRDAGVMNTPEGRTQEAFETQFGTNHLAHFLLINLLIPTLLASSTPTFNSRIVILSSIAHRFGSVHFHNLNLDHGAYGPEVAYSQSKTANLWTANHLERIYGSQGLHAWSAQPGGVATELMRHMSDSEKGFVASHPQLAKIFKSPAQGAATTVWASTASVLEGRGGWYLEDCQIVGKWEEKAGEWGPGHAEHAYDEDAERKLWDVSMKMVGLI